MRNDSVNSQVAGTPHDQQHKFGASEQPREGAGWYILRCGGGTEFRARDALWNAGWPAFVPIERKWQARWLRKPREVRYPRFPRYLFVHVVPPLWPPLTRWPLSACIRGVLAMDGRPMPLAPGEVERLRAEDGRVVPPDAAPSLHKAFMPGQRVRVMHGAFRGFEAVLEGIDEDGARFTVSIFGRPVSVGQPLGWLETMV